MYFKFFFVILFVLSVTQQASGANPIVPTANPIVSVLDKDSTTTVGISIVGGSKSANEAKSTLVHEHNEKLITPTSLYVEKEKPDPFALVLDDEPAAASVAGGAAATSVTGETALYTEPETNEEIVVARPFLCVDPEKEISKTTLCSDGEGIIAKMIVPEAVKIDVTPNKGVDLKEVKKVEEPQKAEMIVPEAVKIDVTPNKGVDLKEVKKVEEPQKAKKKKKKKKKKKGKKKKKKKGKKGKKGKEEPEEPEGPGEPEGEE